MKSKDKQIYIKVCKKCDAPLPYKPDSLSYFKNSEVTCDDCLEIMKNENKRS